MDKPVMAGLLRNSLLTFLSTAVPAIVAVLAIPYIIDHLGGERFGALALIWVIFGYLGFFDLGLGRATTFVVSKEIAKQNHNVLGTIVWSSILITALLGIAIAPFVGMSIPALVRGAIRPPSSLFQETVFAFYIVAAALPITLAAAACRGALEGFNRFDLVTVARIPLGCWAFLSPLLACSETQPLVVASGLLVAGRAAVLCYFLWHCHTLVGRPTLRVNDSLVHIRTMLRFGGWLTITNIVGPVLVSVDRFFISALVGVSALAYYAPPMEIVSRATIFAAAISIAMFPSMTRLIASSITVASHAYSLLLRIVALAPFPVFLLLSIFAEPLLKTWLGASYAEKGALSMQVIAIGTYLSSISQIPFSVVQGAGRPDWSAKVHLVEVCVYIPALTICVYSYGIVGAALAWAGRILVDLAAHLWLASAVLERSVANLATAYVGITSLTGFLAVTLVFPLDVPNARLAIFAALMFVWSLHMPLLFSKQERALLKDRLTGLVARRPKSQ